MSNGRPKEHWPVILRYPDLEWISSFRRRGWPEVAFWEMCPGREYELFQVTSSFVSATDNGSQFLIALPTVQALQTPYNVVLNWQAGLKK